jgi:Subtilase family/Peptidase family C25
MPEPTHIATPLAPEADLACEGFIVQFGRPGDAGAARKLLKAAAAVLPGAWDIRALGGKSSDYLLRRSDGKMVALELCWEWAARLAALPGVRDAEPSLFSPPPVKRWIGPQKKTAPKSSGSGGILPCARSNELWSLEMMQVPEAWAIEPPAGGRKLGQGIRVGHPDTGYRPHPELIAAGQVRADLGYNFEEDNDNPTDLLDGSAPGHGTATGSVIMSPRGKQLPGAARGVSGAAPLAELVPFRVSNNVVHFSMARVTQAIYAAIDRGCHVVSMSLGGPFSSNALERAIAAAADAGVILMAAAGNQWPFVVVPARLDGVMAIAACNCQSRPWSGSARGDTVDVTAPGESVWRASVSSQAAFDVAPGSGTSYAVASAAGVCALWLAWHGRHRLLQKYGARGLVRVFAQRLRDTAVAPPGWDRGKFGTGIVNAAALLKPLRAAAPAKSKAKKAAAGEKTPAERALDRVSLFFPGAASSDVRRAVAGVFGVSAGELPALAPEIAFHLLASPKLRAEVERRIVRPPGKSKAVRSEKRAAELLRRHPQLASTASGRLRAHILGSPPGEAAVTAPKPAVAGPQPAAALSVVDKAIITSHAALRKKYGVVRMKKVDAAIEALIAADKRRGVASRVFDLSDAGAMTAHGLAGPPARLTPEYVKAAVDAIYAAWRPAYLMLLGAPDIIPYVPMDNPVDDEDDEVPGDLPYAGDHPYSTDPQDFRAPTRVVGRLPDIHGSTNPKALLAALRQAATWKKKPKKDYNAFFGLSCASWSGSTTKNLGSLFGAGSRPLLSPPDGPRWSRSQLAPRSHFFNCHGALSDAQLYGEEKLPEDSEEEPDQPVCFRSGTLSGKVTGGAVVAAECCYGAELYEPDTGISPSVANRYFENGAWAFAGSTTIAYGPADSLGDADLISQFFLQHLRAGASTGRAFLQARLDFVKAAKRLSPTEVKTLAQFVLLGDPSIHPVAAGSPPKAAARGAASAKAKHAATSAAPPAGRDERRRRLHLQGQTLRETTPLTTKTGKAPASIVSKMLTRCGVEKSALVRSASYVAPARPPEEDAPPVAKFARRARHAAKSGRPPKKAAAAPGPTVKFHVVIVERKPLAKPKSATTPAVKSRAEAKAGKSGLRLSERRARVRRFQQRAFILLGREVHGKLTVTALQPH